MVDYFKLEKCIYTVTDIPTIPIASSVYVSGMATDVKMAALQQAIDDPWNTQPVDQVYRSGPWNAVRRSNARSASFHIATHCLS